MAQELVDEHLSRISTYWSLVEQMHNGPAEAASSAQRQLVQRYVTVGEAPETGG
jgi:hypothetical protein